MAVTFEVPDPAQPIGSFVRSSRLSAHLTQEELAQRSGVARPNIAAIESGARRPSPEMVLTLLASIRGDATVRPRLPRSPAVLVNIELARAAAFRICEDPDASRRTMRDELSRLHRAVDGEWSDRWLDDWDSLLERWDLAEVLILLLSTDTEDVDRRKVSPICSILGEVEIHAAVERARELWRATS